MYKIEELFSPENEFLAAVFICLGGDDLVEAVVSHNAYRKGWTTFVTEYSEEVFAFYQIRPKHLGLSAPKNSKNLSRAEGYEISRAQLAISPDGDLIFLL